METQKNNGMCRCCASEGTFKDVKSSYQWMGEEEIYADMLRECLDIALCADVTGEVEGGICEVCITQLRNASNFKKQVLHTEEQFKQRIQDKLFKNEIVKVELSPQHEEDSDNDNVLDNTLDDDYSGTEYEVPVKTEVDESKPKKRGKTVKASTSRAKKLKKEDGESSKRASNLITEERKKMYIDLEKNLHNLQQIRTYTNATMIRKQIGNSYVCCFCPKNFPAPADLKKHNLNQHSGENYKNVSNRQTTKFLVKLDITALQCKLCQENIDTLEQLIEHLTVNHELHLYTDVDNVLVPMKFSPVDVQLTCFMCSNVFNKFKALLEHMNSHYRNFVCGVCDAGYVNKATYCAHYLRHLTGAFKCRFCPQVFDVRGKKHTHERTVHTHGEKKKINRCGICDETFEYFFQKERHRREVHNVGGEVKCQACDRIFRYAKDLRIHVRRDHLMDKRFKCAHCDMKFFTNTLLNDHMAKHTRVKAFKCDMCHKAYTRRNTLVAHKKKAHKNIDVVDDDAATETESD